jgi:quercetin dioxygenase-like cupin family protein
MVKAAIRISVVGIGCLVTAAFSPLANAQEKAGTAPAPASASSFRKEVFHNDRVAAYLLEIPPQKTTPLHRYDKDVVSVFVSGGNATSTVEGRPPSPETYSVGEVRYKRAGFAQAIRNDGTEPFRAAILEFTQPQGESISEQLPVKRQCNEGSTRICVQEKHLFCTTAICAEDVTMAPGATRGGFASDSDQMLVAVTDYQLSDEFDGSTTSSTERASGQVEWIPKGNSANRRTNAGSTTARFILIRFTDR